jgi:methylated-DNA-[protein]-cysteine S-methyltransferase
MASDRTTRAPGVTGSAAITIATPLGWVCAVSRAGRLVAVSLPSETRDRALAACGAEDFGERGDAVLEALLVDLQRYFAGEPIDLGRHPVDLSGQPAFHRRALLAARGISYGEVRTYGWLAAAAGRPRAARAAGHAMSRNPIALVIPCHRVVAADGGLGGFGGGLEMKRALLALEGVQINGRRVRR